MPGRTVDVTITLKDPSGRPLAGEVTLWLVDQAVLALGKHGDQFDNTSADTAEGYVKTILDVSIPRVEREVGLRIHTRGNELTLVGQPDQVELARTLLVQLHALARRGRPLRPARRRCGRSPPGQRVRPCPSPGGRRGGRRRPSY